MTADDELLGATLDGRYRIEARIGAGGMGTVYRARHLMLGERVAIKVLRPDAGEADEAARRFVREARSTFRVDHPHCVRVTDLGATGGLLYLVMEHLDGRTARRELEVDGALAPVRVAHVAAQVCSALAAAHDLGLIHRDLKPDNLMLLRRGADADFVKVLDFGLAKMFDPDGALATALSLSPLTREGLVFGTPEYMSPEQLVGNKVDHRADIYSLGVVFYELLTGELPHEDLKPPSSRTRRIQIDVRLDEVVLRALEKMPERRYQQASEFQTGMQTLTAGVPSKPQSSAAGASEFFRRRWKGLAAMAAVLAIAIVAIPRAPWIYGLSPIETEVPREMTLLRIPAGTFTMGSPLDEIGRFAREGPQHTVTISRDYYLGETPVTWNQWYHVYRWAVVNGYTDLAIGSRGLRRDTHDVSNEAVTLVSWWDAVKWLNAISEMEGKTPVYYSSEGRSADDVLRSGSETVEADWSANGYRLPTEAEWEYACRAGTTTAFNTGPITFAGPEPLDSSLDRAGWYSGNSEESIHPVGLKEPNAWGLYDMHGNVWEWCWNFEEVYTDTPKTDPVGPSVGVNRIRRGGNWRHDADHSRSASRIVSNPLTRYNGIGLRAARNSEL